MKSLIDTQSLIWAVDNPTKLGSVAVGILTNADNELLVSAARVSQAAVICATHDALLTQRADVVLPVGAGQSSPR